MKIRALIVDDEPPARMLISTLLREEPDIEVVGECANGAEAVAAIRNEAPDLVFLDVRMPGLDGFEVLAALDPRRLPLIVFVTAHDAHAVRAFEVHALDYLLKPYEYGRLHDSILRARACLETKASGEYRDRLLSLAEDWFARAQSWDRLVIREAGRVLFLKPDDIDWIESEGNYLRLHLGKESCLLRQTMAEAEARLAGRRFLRLSRSTMVNLERVREWQPLFHGDSVVLLRDGTRLTVSRRYRDKFDQMVARMG